MGLPESFEFSDTLSRVTVEVRSPPTHQPAKGLPTLGSADWLRVAGHALPRGYQAASQSLLKSPDGETGTATDRQEKLD